MLELTNTGTGPEMTVGRMRLVCQNTLLTCRKCKGRGTYWARLPGGFSRVRTTCNCKEIQTVTTENQTPRVAVFEIRLHYGAPRYYPHNDVARAICAIAKRETADVPMLKLAKHKLGLTLAFESPPQFAPPAI